MHPEQLDKNQHFIQLLCVFKALSLALKSIFNKIASVMAVYETQ